MPKWSKDAKEFSVNVHYDKEKGSQVRIPKPLLDQMGNPDKVTFVISGENIKIIPTTEAEQARYSMLRKRGKMK